MRNLLVVSQSHLPGDIVSLLERKHWAVIHAQDLKIARHLDMQHHFLVGCVVLHNTKNTQLTERLQAPVLSLPHIKWIAALDEELVEMLDIKRFITESLYDFQVFPIEGARLATVLGHAYGMAKIERELQHSDQLPPTSHAPDFPGRFGVIGKSTVMLTLYRMLQRAAESDASVLITGPTGTGKELAARAIHSHSARAEGPFVAINCAAITPTLLQSELFGHEKGAFTSASTRKTGYIQTAVGGTLFLDEIGDLPLESQAALLRFLEDKIVTPVGSTRGKEVDVRIIASTNVDLEQAIQDKRFRADLYYRLAFLTIQTPGLSSREEDIELLAKYFLAEVMVTAGTRRLRFSEAALAVMRGYAWPGNVRELRSVVFQAALSCEGLAIRPENLKIHLDSPALKIEFPMETREASGTHHRNSNGSAILGSLKNAREQSEKRNLEFALERHASNVTRAAQDLGVSRMTLYRLMAKHGLARSGAN
ncbi:sigma-54 interaction domain-containing protein [Thiobaca trueperi]|uniref:DNA-binding NtrC family response regulator n=1 Tax=Thiobaca trueperi TaxID=127458 RepID=A0A4R3MW02_9GAMM|nr:sigma-54 dependent transcriptional regulator [Thiobaca trueperi]TCT20738.1 DNA-binding NtrC family response regulator [Thiobaca trueperi]